MIIYVSAFISRVNQRHDRCLEKYIDYGKKWMALPYPKIVFMEHDVVSEYLPETQNKQYEHKSDGVWYNETTWIQYFNPRTMYFYEYVDKVRIPLDIHTQNPNKDTLEYMFVQCYKTEWMSLAIQHYSVLIPVLERMGYKTEPQHLQYMWNDFGIFHMFEKHNPYPELLFRECYEKLEKRNATRYQIALEHNYDFSKVYFSSCWGNIGLGSHDIYRNICWVFAGSVFSGFQTPLLKLSGFMREKCIELMTKHGRLMWEVNVWVLLKNEHPELFDYYICNHDPTMITHF